MIDHSYKQQDAWKYVKHRKRTECDIKNGSGAEKERKDSQ
jgi:hypothetical protein